MNEKKAEYMYNVMAEGKANAVFDAADEALRFSMHHVYLATRHFEPARAALERGEDFFYAYGFATVHIVPVKKRALTKEEVLTMSTHTPGPWRVVHTADDRTFIDTEESNDNFIAQVDRNVTEYEANAAFIVRACNSHEAILEALKLCVEALEFIPCRARNKAEEALRLAEGRGVRCTATTRSIGNRSR